MRDNVEILVVDDTPANLAIVTEILSLEGYTVSVATNGEGALKRLQQQQNDFPSLILLDIQMPGIDGFETCRQIKANPHTTAIPIIFLTALSDTDNIVKGLTLGAVDYVGKPFQEAVLLARVRTHLKLQFLNQMLEKQVQDRTYELEVSNRKLQDTLTQLDMSQLQLIQQEKMSALGNMVAGIAHEINNPLGFISGNLSALELALHHITACLQAYRAALPDPGEKIQALQEDMDIDFVLEDLPQMLESMKIGCDRLHCISSSLRIFSRADMEFKVNADIHEELDSTLLILQYRLKAKDDRPQISILKEYGNLPQINCFPGQLSQVFMNILANAIDMFDEMAETMSYDKLEAKSLQIKIKTCTQDSNVMEISIRDNGVGISQETCAKIFNRDFTTKKVGKGTGLGLAIARQIVEQNHGGYLGVDSTPGQGSNFLIQLPVQAQDYDNLLTIH